MADVPAWARFLLDLLLTVGITLLAVRLLRRPILAINSRDQIEKDARARRAEERERAAEAAGVDVDDLGPPEPPAPPDAFYLAGRVLAITATGFVFLLAFTLGNFWGMTKQAASATQTEAADWTRAAMLAERLPADEGGTEVVGALQAYRESVADVQWPLMQRADTDSVYREQAAVAVPLGDALLAAASAGAGDRPEFGELTSTVEDMLDQAMTRIDALPNPAAPGVLALIFVLGLSNLALTVAWQPARLAPNLWLMGIMAAITALLLFVVVEASNPYAGATSVALPAIGAP